MPSWATPVAAAGTSDSRFILPLIPGGPVPTGTPFRCPFQSVRLVDRTLFGHLTGILPVCRDGRNGNDDEHGEDGCAANEQVPVRFRRRSPRGNEHRSKDLHGGM